MPHTSPNTKLVHKYILHVPDITINLLFVSKLTKDDCVMFDFLANKCFVKSQVSNKVILEG